MPKALVPLGGVPLVVHAVRRLIAVGGVSHVVVVVPPSHEGEFGALLEPLHGEGAVQITAVAGGAERSDSVRNGLRALDRDCDVVLVHDAARCLAPVELAERVLAAVDAGADAVVPGIPVNDTIKVVEPTERPAENPADGATDSMSGPASAHGAVAEHVVVSTPPRADLLAIQTPQGFRRSALVAAHESGADATDDAGLIEAAGGTVHVVPGDVLALKVTTPIDIVIAEHLLADISEADPV